MIRADSSRDPRLAWFKWPTHVRVLLIGLTCAGSVGLLSQIKPSTQTPTLSKLVIDPNTAPPEALLALPMLGPTLVARIIEARPFTSLDDLDRRVSGIGPATISALRPHLKIWNEPTIERRAGQANTP